MSDPYRTQAFVEPVERRESFYCRIIRKVKRRFLVMWYGKFVDRHVVKCHEHKIHNCKCLLACQQRIFWNIIKLSMSNQTSSVGPR